jgi:Flp pilus assembly protein TadB
MTWQIPTWYGTILLALAAFRTWRLLAEDEILDRTRDRAAPEATKRAAFIACAYCFGFWISLLWWLAFIAWPHWSVIIAVPFAISALVGIIASKT